MLTEKTGSELPNRPAAPDPSAWVVRTVNLSSRRTSVKLEAIFWIALEGVAAELGTSWRSLVARIATETEAADPALPLSRAIRVWLIQRLQSRLHQAEAPKPGGTP